MDKNEREELEEKIKEIYRAHGGAAALNRGGSVRADYLEGSRTDALVFEVSAAGLVGSGSIMIQAQVIYFRFMPVRLGMSLNADVKFSPETLDSNESVEEAGADFKAALSVLGILRGVLSVMVRGGE